LSVNSLFESHGYRDNGIKFSPEAMFLASGSTLWKIKFLHERYRDHGGIRMSRVFEGVLHVDYGQAYVLTGEMLNPDLFDAFRGQTNGLCGAAVRGALWLITGKHIGHVGFTVDILDAAPPIDEAWEEIVEVSFTVVDEDEELEYDDFEIMERGIKLAEWSIARSYPIPLPPGSYRVRYCARGMQLGHDRRTLLQGKRPVDFYSLSFWPADAAPDCIVKQTSKIAAYWHECAQRLRN
jgi:hypothetical protein